MGSQAFQSCCRGLNGVPGSVMIVTLDFRGFQEYSTGVPEGSGPGAFQGSGGF